MLPYVLSICFICSTKYLDLKIGAINSPILNLHCHCCAVCCVLYLLSCSVKSPDETLRFSFFFFVSFPLLLLFSFPGFLNSEELGTWTPLLRCDDSNVDRKRNLGNFLSREPGAQCPLCVLCPEVLSVFVREFKITNVSHVQTDSAQPNCDSISTDLI